MASRVPGLRFVFSDRQTAVALHYGVTQDPALRLSVTHALHIRTLVRAARVAKHFVLVPVHALRESHVWCIMRWRTIMAIARLDALLIAGGHGWSHSVFPVKHCMKSDS